MVDGRWSMIDDVPGWSKLFTCARFGGGAIGKILGVKTRMTARERQYLDTRK